MSKQKAVILGKGREPDADEKRLVEALRTEKSHARFVYCRSDRLTEPEKCTIAFSKHKDLLEPYPNSEIINSKSGGAKGVVPQDGFPPLPDGYCLHKAGTAYWKLIDGDGVQVHPKGMLKRDMIPFLEGLQ